MVSPKRKDNIVFGTQPGMISINVSQLEFSWQNEEEQDEDKMSEGERLLCISQPQILYGCLDLVQLRFVTTIFKI